MEALVDNTITNIGDSPRTVRRPFTPTDDSSDIDQVMNNRKRKVNLNSMEMCVIFLVLARGGIIGV
jgi:hypothetical protein